MNATDLVAKLVTDVVAKHGEEWLTDILVALGVLPERLPGVPIAIARVVKPELTEAEAAAQIAAAKLMAAR